MKSLQNRIILVAGCVFLASLVTVGCRSQHPVEVLVEEEDTVAPEPIPTEPELVMERLTASAFDLVVLLAAEGVVPVSSTEAATVTDSWSSVAYSSGAGVPFTGSVVDGSEGATFVVDYANQVVPIGDTPHFLVGARTGLWLHQNEGLLRLARLLPPPIGPIAVSPDGRLLAVSPHPFEQGRSFDGVREVPEVELQLYELPSLRQVGSVVRTSTPYRMRFSSGGEFLATASWDGTVTLVDFTGDQVQEHRTGDAITDVLPLSTYPHQVLATDFDDDFWIYDFSSSEIVFFQHYRSDQMVAVAGPNEEFLVVGGDNNTITTVHHTANGWERANTARSDGNARSAACCWQGNALVGVDTAGVYVVGPDGNRIDENRLDTMLSNMDSVSMDLAVASDQRVLITVQGRLLSWNPASGDMTRSLDYHNVSQQYETGRGAHLLRRTAPIRGIDLHFAPLGEPGVAVQSQLLGQYEGDTFAVPFPDGTLLLGERRSGGFVLTPYLGGVAGQSAETSVGARVHGGMRQAASADGQQVAVLDSHTGTVSLFTRDPPSSRILANLIDARWYGLTFDSEAGCWVVEGRGDDRQITTRELCAQ